MKKFLVKLAFLILLVALGLIGWRAGELQRANIALRETVAQLEQERRDLQGQAAQVTRAPKPEEQAEVRQRVEEQTSELRGLKFLRPVQYRMIERSALRQFLEKKLKEHYTDQELHDWGRSLAAIGLIPPGTDLKEAMLGLYDEQVGAFYIPEEHALYTFKDQTWSRGLDRMFLAHELTHALQDQNFDLQKFPLEARNNDDLVLATSALVEGDATVLMTEYYATNADPSSLLGDIGAILGQNMTKLANAPPFLRESLIFPYQEGQLFAMALYLKGGTAALDEAFRKPPVSTEQILHPEKYQSPRDDPQSVDVPKIESNDWKQIGDNVLGEFGIRSLLQQRVPPVQAELAARGWDGDRYRVYERGVDGPTAFVWISVWDSEQDAIEFEEAYNNLLKKRTTAAAAQAKVHRDGSRVTIVQSPERAFFDLADRTRALTLRPDDR